MIQVFYKRKKTTISQGKIIAKLMKLHCKHLKTIFRKKMVNDPISTNAWYEAFLGNGFKYLQIQKQMIGNVLHEYTFMKCNEQKYL